MFNCNHKEDIKELREEMRKLEERQMSFLIHFSKVLNIIMDNDKRKFMYEVRQEDLELIEDGNKYRAIKKIIS